MGTQVLRRHRSLTVALLVGLLALGAGVLWLFRTADRVAAPDNAQTVQDGDLRVTLQLDQPTLGDRVVDITVRDAVGNAVPLRGARLAFSMAEMDMGTITVDTQPVGTGRFQARGAFFTMAGRWVVEVLLQRANGALVRVPFTAAIAAPGEANGPLNPLTANAPTLAAGRQLYQDGCAVCHGVRGNGNGPAATTLNPRPSDFTQHMIAGKHTDGQIFLWIKNGYPNTAMPAWGQRLSDEQIWQLVTYLRTFGQAAPAASLNGARPTVQPSMVLPTQPIIAPEPLPPLIFVRQGNLWRSDGSAHPPRPITTLNAGSYAEYPVLAPDGSQIAFVTTTQAPITETTQLPLPTPKTTLDLMRADGTSRQTIWAPARGILGVPAWAPDGRALLVGYADILSAPDAPVPDRLFQIVRVDATTGARQVLLNDARDPSISRDGKVLAYLHFDKAYYTFTVHVATSDGSGDREVVGPGAFSDLATPRLSPDGTLIIFAAQGGPPTDPQGYPIKAEHASPLHRLLGLLTPATVEAHGSPWDVWIVNRDGSGLRRIPMAREDSPMAVFSPDGKDIVMMGAGGIYRLHADGSNLRKIDPLGDHGGLDWASP